MLRTQATKVSGQHNPMNTHSTPGSQYQENESNRFLNSYFGVDHLSSRQGAFNNNGDISTPEICCYPLGDLTISRIQFRQSTSLTCRSVTDAYYLQFVVSGHCISSCTNTMLDMTTAHSTVINPGSQRYVSYSGDTELLVVKIPRSSLIQAAMEFGFIQTGQDILFRSTPINREQSGSLFHLLQAIMVQLHQPVAGSAGEYYARLLSLAILKVFPANIADGHLSRPADHPHIEAVRNYVLHNITDDFDIDHLASLCHVSTKTLYNIFNRELGITPANYIRGIKLESIHQELRQGENIRNVTEIAIRYGFTNLSRFSNQYKQLFGELPSATLKNSRRMSVI